MSIYGSLIAICKETMQDEREELQKEQAKTQYEYEKNVNTSQKS